jgi:hypothetical protein
MAPNLNDLKATLTTWLAERVPSQWLAGPIDVDVDREEAVVVLPLAREVDATSFRGATREKRMELARQAEDAFGLKISWGTSSGGRRRLFTTVRSEVVVPVALPERKVLDGLVAAGVAADRSEAVAWCIRLVGQHEGDWLRDLEEAVAGAPPRRPERPVAM